MEIKDFFPMWDNLEEKEKNILEKKVVLKSAKSGDILYDSDDSCSGLILVASGQLRAFYMSERRFLMIIRAPCIRTTLRHTYIEGTDYHE